MDKNTKIVSAISAISSIFIFITIVQAYQTYQQTATISNIQFDESLWERVINNTSDKTYLFWYDNNLNGLTLDEHKDYSRIALSLQSANKLNGFTENGFNFQGLEGWRMTMWYWINDPMFKKYWETDNDSYDEKTWLLINYFQSLTEEECLALAQKERMAEKLHTEEQRINL